jgi:ketosteroid isomerase-like protein
MRCLLVGMLLFPISVCAQDSSVPRGSPDQLKADIVQIEREAGRANFNCDYQYFAKLEAEEFIFTDAKGGVTTKQQDLAGEKDCRKFDGTFDLDETQVRLYGDAAVVTARVTVTGKNKEGAPFRTRSRFTDVFVWRDGRWQIVAGHSSHIPEPGG